MKMFTLYRDVLLEDNGENVRLRESFWNFIIFRNDNLNKTTAANILTEISPETFKVEAVLVPLEVSHQDREQAIKASCRRITLRIA